MFPVLRGTTFIQAVYYTVIKHSSHLRTLEKLRKHSPAARVFYISLVFSNACRVLAQCNTRLRLLYLLNIWYFLRYIRCFFHYIRCFLQYILFKLCLVFFFFIITGANPIIAAAKVPSPLPYIHCKGHYIRYFLVRLLLHTSRFFVGRQKNFICRLVLML